MHLLLCSLHVDAVVSIKDLEKIDNSTGILCLKKIMYYTSTAIPSDDQIRMSRLRMGYRPGKSFDICPTSCFVELPKDTLNRFESLHPELCPKSLVLSL